MGLQQSREELLYEQVNCGNIESIRALRREGAGLEWTDKEGKTPLIVACTTPELYNVAKTLIELGASVNAYCPGHFGGTPLHYAAKRGLEHTVKLLLQHGANALVMNGDFQTPLDIARAKGYGNVVRAIEGHVCLFSGWLQQIYGPGFLEVLAPQLLSRRVWAVVLPCGSRNLQTPFRLELAIYAHTQDAQPRTIVPLWKVNVDELNFNQPDPAVIISDISRIPRRWKRRRAIKSSQESRSKQIKFIPVDESETLQLQRFFNACKGIPLVQNPLEDHLSFPSDFPVPMAPADAPSSTSEDEELPSDSPERSAANESTSLAYSENGSKIETQTCPAEGHVVQIPRESPSPVTIPSAPPAKDRGPIHYPSLDIGISGSPDEKKDGVVSSSCTICLDAPIEGACIPCGHMVGCMMCLNEINTKKWGCPLCRSPIDKVVRIYCA